MFYLDQQTRKRYRIGTPFSYGDFNYTNDGANHDTFISLGFVQVIPAPRPDDAFYFVDSPCLDDGSWSYSERDLADVQQSFCARQVQAAQDNLKSTDYLFARAAENTTRAGEASPVPAEVMTQREAVRLTCKANCALIMSAADIAALEAMIKAPAEVPENPMIYPPVMIPNTEPHLEPLPTIDVSAYLTPELI